MDSQSNEPSTSLEAKPTILPENDSTFQMSLQMVVETIFMVFGVPSNILAIFFLWKKSNGSLSPAVPLLVNLAAADLLVLTVFMPFYLVYEAMEFHWPFGVLLCKGVFSLTYICMYASLATLVTIALERYLITFYNSIKQSLVRYLIVVIWVVAFILSIPQLVFLQTINVNSHDGVEEEEFLSSDKEAEDELEEIYICDIVWPQPNFEKILQPIDAVILYLVPLAFFFVIYVKIVLKLRAIDGKRLPPARRVFVKQRKCVIRKMIAVIAIFALCHLPIHVFHLLRVFFYQTWEVLVTEYPWLFSFCANLVLATHVINPFLYGSIHRCFICSMGFIKRLDCRPRFSSSTSSFRSPLIRWSNTKQTFVKN